MMLVSHLAGEYLARHDLDTMNIRNAWIVPR
jgi:hypothetical protein